MDRDIVERLRTMTPFPSGDPRIFDDAADEIMKLRSKVEDLEGTIKEMESEHGQR
jgi:hypothetical protein